MGGYVFVVSFVAGSTILHTGCVRMCDGITGGMRERERFAHVDI